jgi:cell division protein FtsB
VRWDRVGRLSLLTVLAVVFGLYVEHTLSFLQTRSQSVRAQAYVRELVRENAALRAEQRALNQPATIIARARALGMVRRGERAFVVVGLPGR